MRKHYLPSTAIASALLLLACCIPLAAQTRDKFVISAKAGGVNAVTGDASVHGKGRVDWQQLTVTDDLNAGDIVRTAPGGRVEILLNPGSYLRIGGDSEFELADNSLSNLEVRLLRGTAIVEATGFEGTELMINISTPHAKLAIVRGGLYRLNVMPGDGTELIVRKGRVILSNSHTKVKGGNKVVFSATATAIAKLTKEEKKKSLEEIEVWSKDRSKTLAKANERITQRMMTSAFTSMRGTNIFGYGRSSGLWFFNAGMGCYTFLPLFYGWGSPYGNSYQTSIYNFGYASRGAYINPGYSNPNGGTSVVGNPGMPGTSSGPGGIPGGSAAPRSAPTSPELGNRGVRKLETMTDPNRP